MCIGMRVDVCVDFGCRHVSPHMQAGAAPLLVQLVSSGDVKGRYVLILTNAEITNMSGDLLLPRY